MLHGGGDQLHLAITYGFLQGKMYTALYIEQVVNPELLPFLRQEGDVP